MESPNNKAILSASTFENDARIRVLKNRELNKFGALYARIRAVPNEVIISVLPETEYFDFAREKKKKMGKT